MSLSENIQRKLTHARDTALAYSPYLAENIAAFPDLTEACLVHGPDPFWTEIEAKHHEGIQPFPDEMEQLRILKRKLHVVLALCEISKMWNWVQVTERLTHFADIVMARLLCAAASQAGFTPLPDNPVPGLFIVAMGKYGARELNYSSDIDFCIFYNPNHIELPDPSRAKRTLLRLCQSLIHGFESLTEHGYIFRTDLRLRPDPRANQIVISTQTAERYYETLGQNWERAAMIKARVCSGDKDIGQRFYDRVLTPFVWRRSLDYNTLEDIHTIKQQTQTVKSLRHIVVAGHNLKLGTGGIREIEFFAQLQQLIFAGRHPKLRQARTVEALRSLTEFGVVAPETGRLLINAYAQLRLLEHTAQMIADNQTHTVPEEAVARENFARLAGFDNLHVFDKQLEALLKKVHFSYNSLFADALSEPKLPGRLGFTGVEPDPPTLRTLARMGFKKGPEIWTIMTRWIGGRITATRFKRSRTLLTRLAPNLLTVCSRFPSPDEAFFAFAHFFTRLQSSIAILSMFLQKPDILEHTITLILSSSRIRESLTKRPQSFYVMIDPDFNRLDKARIKTHYLPDTFCELGYEEVLNKLRGLIHEDHLRLCADILQNPNSMTNLPDLLSEIADQAIAIITQAVSTDIRETHGPLHGHYAIIGFGKYGGRELTLASDLDLMVVYEPHAHLKTERANVPLNFSRFTRRLITGLSIQTQEGGLYEVDMKLRPSGRSGPVAVSFESFSSYYRMDAWVWEFMALTRARIVYSSSEEFAVRVRETITRELTKTRDPLTVKQAIYDMLARTKAERSAPLDWDIKEQNGGLREIEYLAQFIYLTHATVLSPEYTPQTQQMLSQVFKKNLISSDEHKVLQAALQFFNQCLQIHALLSTQPIHTIRPSAEQFLSQYMGYETVSKLRTARDQHYENVRMLRAQHIGIL